MSKEQKESPESIEQQKVAAVDSFIQTLQLDPNKDGAKIAALVEDYEKMYPDQWLAKLDEIMVYAANLQTESTQQAMFYLGDVILHLNKRLAAEQYSDNKEEMQVTVEIFENALKSIKRAWNPNARSIPGSVSNDSVPMWWTFHEAEQGKFDVVTAQYAGGNVQRIAEILDETKY